MLQQYIRQIYDFLADFGAAPIFCSIVSNIAVYGLLIYMAVAIIILFGNVTKLYKIKKSDMGIFSAFFLIFFVVIITTFIPVYQKAILEPWGGLIPFITTMIGGMIQEPSLFKKLLLLGMMLLMLLLLGVYVVFMFGSLYAVWMTFESTIKKNGLFLGILVGIYELFAGIFWLALLLALFSIGTAIIMMPFIIFISTHRIVDFEEKR